ncbi:helix-turn-helix transcriptional regulator [Aliagarivorans marinus]|uniref:helix-turn-helix transcriptional regulator n=1 Tax=Aliagarivorans marinus TaxID=561965 RepID=UPI000408A04C|nr:AraC family transcriptional regulator ligand-binding domain-containing protein [Aliagarivorans marinus]
MKRASRFAVSPNWAVHFKDLGVETHTVLRLANLPADLFRREKATLSPDEYFRLWIALDQALGEDRQLALEFTKYMSVEAFDPPIFASLCSDNLKQALQRLAHYKPLIGPLELHIQERKHRLELVLRCYGNTAPLPEALAVGEQVFLTQLARLATREQIKPLLLELPVLPDNREHYEAYFGCRLNQGDDIRMAFSLEDAYRPFLTSNNDMWEFFEAKLQQRLQDIDGSAPISARVKAVLLELLPSGESNIEAVAEKLAMSKRTLQRKLADEQLNYQELLQSLRLELANHYLEKSDMSLGEISFLLGFKESNSFIRAYSGWKGISPGQYREQLH